MTTKNLCQQWESNQHQSHLGSNFLTEMIYTTLIDHLAPEGSQHSRGPSRGQENRYCCHRQHYAKHVRPIEQAYNLSSSKPYNRQTIGGDGPQKLDVLNDE